MLAGVRIHSSPSVASSAIGSDEAHLDARQRPAEGEIGLGDAGMRAEHDGAGFRRAVDDSERRLRERRAAPRRSALAWSAPSPCARSTEDRSVRASMSRSRKTSASMVGTEVSHVTLNRPIASM